MSRQHTHSGTLGGLTPFILTAAALIAITYGGTLRDPFLSDDFRLKFLLNPDGSVDWDVVLGQFAKGWVDWPIFYRPIYAVSFAIDLQLWGLRPLGFRLTNLLLHSANALLLFLLLRRLTGRASVAYAGGVLFTVHALHPGAVTWISGRGDSLAAVFYLLAILLLVICRQSGHRHLFTVALLFTGLAFLSKESALSLPLVLLSYEIIAGDGARGARVLRSGLALTGLIAVYVLLRHHALGVFLGGYGVPPSYSLWAFPLHAIDAFARNLVPVDLATTGTLVYYVGLLAVGLPVSVLMFGNLSHAPEARSSFLFFLSWFFLSLVPFFRLGSLTSNLEVARWLYLPSAAFSGLVAVALLAAPSSRRGVVGPIAMLGLVILHGLLLTVNNAPWSEAARVTQQIQSQVALLRAGLHAQEFALVNIPNRHHAAIISSGLYFGLEPPFLPGSKSPRLAFIGFDNFIPEQYWPLFHLSRERAIPVFRWDSHQERFLPLSWKEFVNAVGESPRQRPGLTLVAPLQGGTVSLRGPEPAFRFAPGPFRQFRVEFAADFATGAFPVRLRDFPIGADGTLTWSFSDAGLRWNGIRVIEERTLLWRVVAIGERGDVLAESPIWTFRVSR